MAQSNCKMMTTEVIVEMLDSHNHNQEFSVGYPVLLLLSGQCKTEIPNDTSYPSTSETEQLLNLAH